MKTIRRIFCGKNKFLVFYYYLFETFGYKRKWFLWNYNKTYLFNVFATDIWSEKIPLCILMYKNVIINVRNRTHFILKQYNALL